jgi:hypothetical protein
VTPYFPAPDRAQTVVGGLNRRSWKQKSETTHGTTTDTRFAVGLQWPE